MSRFAVLGDPIGHSKSPKMHAAAYAALGLSHSYEAIRATPAELGPLVQALRRGEYDGFNVTVPHKQRILEHVDHVDPSASRVLAANTLVRGADGRITAYNTDVPALARELRLLAKERTDAEWRSSKALVLGSGGAARSALAALGNELGVRTVIVRSRRPFDGADGKSVLAEPLARSPVDGEVLTVLQATSAGMTGAEPGDGVAAAVHWERLPANAVALDVVYAPPVTPFVASAQGRGLRVTNGFGMLAMQGALAFELWLGLPAPYEVMLGALR
ncbi:MAG TPA: shikimate dehydrogenase [Polyangiaceae bacterium]|jgi:shikimate dehydrogenase